jgi:hypothetical protein
MHGVCFIYIDNRERGHYIDQFVDISRSIWVLNYISGTEIIGQMIILWKEYISYKKSLLEIINTIVSFKERSTIVCIVLKIIGIEKW